MMTARPLERADQARAALRAIVADPALGVAALSNASQAANAFEDFLPDAPRERAILVMAVKAGLAQVLRDYVTQGFGAATAISLTSASFEEISPLDPQACRWVVTELAVALGLAPEDQRPGDLAVVDASEPAQPQAAIVQTAGGGDAEASPWQAPTVLAAAPGVTRDDQRADAGYVAAGAATRTASGFSAEIPGPAALARTAPGSAHSQPAQRRRGRKNRDPGINDVAFSPDGQLLGTAGSDGTARLWVAETGALVSRLGPHAGPVRSVRFSPDGRLLATAGSPDAARLWEVGTGALVRVVTPGPAWDVAFSPDGRLIATAGGRSRQAGVAAAATADKAAWLWDVASGEVVTGVAGQSGPARAVAFSPDGSLLATAGAGDVVRFWEVSTGRLVRSLPRPIGLADNIAFSPDGILLATVGAGNLTRFWDVATGGQVRSLTPEPARGVAFSPDGIMLATAGGGTRPAPGVAAAAAVDKAAWLWDVATGRLAGHVAGHDDAVQAVAFSLVAGVLATSSRDRTVRLWSLGSQNSPQLQISGS